MAFATDYSGWVDRPDNEQVDLEELLLSLKAEDQDQDQDDKVQLDIERQVLLIYHGIYARDRRLL